MKHMRFAIAVWLVVFVAACNRAPDPSQTAQTALKDANLADDFWTIRMIE